MGEDKPKGPAADVVEKLRNRIVQLERRARNILDLARQKEQQTLSVGELKRLLRLEQEVVDGARRQQSLSLGEMKRLIRLEQELLDGARRQTFLEEQSRYLTAEVERLASALRKQSAAARHAKGETSQNLPLRSIEEIKAIGSVRVDAARGIIGSARFPDYGDVAPVVELRVEDSLVVAQVGQRRPTGSNGEEHWHFSFPWERIALEFAGREATVVIAGSGQELGRAVISPDLLAFQLSPAARASFLLGANLEETRTYHDWIEQAESGQEQGAAIAFLNEALNWPVISVIVFPGCEEELPQTLQTIRAQTYRNWEVLCISSAEAGELDPKLHFIRPEEADAAMRYIRPDALLAFVQSGDTIAPNALLHLAAAHRAQPNAALIYSDEDLADPGSGLRALPWFKGAWSPDLALQQDYCTRLALLPRAQIDTLPLSPAELYASCLRAGLRNEKDVHHVPFVLYHRSPRNVTQVGMSSAAEAAISECYAADCRPELIEKEDGARSCRWPIPQPEPLVSLVVPTRDGLDLLRVCVDGLLNETAYRNLEVIIADNDSSDAETLAYLAAIERDPRVRVVPCHGPFNFSRINNQAAATARGDFIGLINNDIKVLAPDWLSHMVTHAARPEVGIVGAKLLHGDETIQHAGVTMGIGLASHLYKGFAKDAQGHHGRLLFTQDLTAVTAACLIMRSSVYAEVGGLGEEFPVAYNDIDLCLKVRAAGYRVVWTPDAVVFHLESQSRGRDLSPEKRQRLEADKARMVARWGDWVKADPFHSPNLSNRHTDARLAFPSRALAPWDPGQQPGGCI